jgi:hypothetical protein
MPRRSEQDDGFPIIRIAEVQPRPPEGRWLIESLWAASGVGVVGGLPKCCLCRMRHKQHYAASRVMPPGRKAENSGHAALRLRLADGAA